MNIKTGIDYFPLDIDFFQDEKVQFVSARFGTRGEAITVRLLCKIYRNGYYAKWDEDTALLFAKGVGDGCSDSCVNDVVHELVKRGFFDRSIFDRFGILTSRGIQKRYLEAGKRRKKVHMEGALLLVDVSEIQNVSIVSENVYISGEDVNILSQPAHESKVKERESKGKESNNARTREGFDSFWKSYPKKKAKGDAEKAFSKLKPDAELLKTMLDAIEAQSRLPDWTKDGGQFIPYPATWINQRRWEDEVSSPQESKYNVTEVI